MLGIMSLKKYLIVVGGATASGKTAFAVQLAQYFCTEIVSCDSRQFYKEMNIGTARPSEAEMQGIRHHFVAQLSIFEPYNVGDFERDGLKLLEKLYENHDMVVAVGGSGLYIKALCEGLDAFPDIPENIRQEVRHLYQQQGLEGLQGAVQQVDPDYYTVVDHQNPHRLIRALEVSRASGQPFSSFRQKKARQRPFTPIYIQIDLPRVDLYERINHRVDDMMQRGLLAEVEKLYPHHQLMSLQTVGYQELFDYLAGKTTQAIAIDKIKQNSRNYAKRQLTWWRRDGFWHQVRPDEVTEAIQFIEKIINISA